jgi:hypothetical protein
MTWSSLLVNCGGVALPSYLISEGMSYSIISLTSMNASTGTNMSGDKDWKGSSICEEAHMVDRLDNSIHLYKIMSKSPEDSDDKDILSRL